MAEKQQQPQAVDVERIKKALVTAGVIKAATIAKADEARLEKELARRHVDKLRLRFTIICHSSHYCIVVKGLN